MYNNNNNVKIFLCLYLLVVTICNVQSWVPLSAPLAISPQRNRNHDYDDVSSKAQQQQLQRQRHNYHFTTTTSSQLHSSRSNSNSLQKDSDILYQRVFYRLSSASQVNNYKAIVVEELVRYQKKASDSSSIVPIGPRTLVLRDGNVDDGEIGDILYRLDIPSKGGSHNGAGLDRSMEATICTILYLAASSSSLNHMFLEGNVLELSCDLGLASVLGTIAVVSSSSSSRTTPTTTTTTTTTTTDVANKEEEEEEKEEEKDDEKEEEDAAGSKKQDDILTIPDHIELPEGMKMLFLSDITEQPLNDALQIVQKSTLPSSQVSYGVLDWSHRSATTTRGGAGGLGGGGMMPMAPPTTKSNREYHTILGCNLDLSYPTAKELARTIAYRLEPSSSFHMNQQQYTTVPTFVHISRDDIEDTSNVVLDLQKLLQRGYNMQVSTNYIKLEKIMFAVQTLPSSSSTAADKELQQLDELDLEVQEYRDTIYKSLLASHSPQYSSGMGELFFPMETGEFDARGGGGGGGSRSSSTSNPYLEPETDSFGSFGGSGSGSGSGSGGNIGGGNMNPF